MTPRRRHRPDARPAGGDSSPVGPAFGKLERRLLLSADGAQAGDLDGDGRIDVTDLAILAACWGQGDASGPSPADLTGDGRVDDGDLDVLSTGWATDAPQTPPPPQPTGGEYRDYAGVTDALADLAARYGDLARLSSLGRSVQGRELWAIRITDQPDRQEDEPEVKIVSTLHGDEPIGTELTLRLAEHLLSSYGVDAELTNLVDETDIWLVPLANPDGLELGTRANARGADLNRSFPEGSGSGDLGNVFLDTPMDLHGRQPETAAVMQWSAAHRFVVSMGLHSGALVVNYPYDNDARGHVDSPSPDDLLFEHLSTAYASRNPPMAASRRFAGGITNGAAWYSMSGGMQDWNYRYLSCLEVTVELSDTKAPPTSSLERYWDDNREAMLAYLAGAHTGVRGVVADAATGEPLSARVSVRPTGVDVYTDPDVGDYHRPLLAGTHELRFAADGYRPVTVPDVAVAEGFATRRDVALRWRAGDADDDGEVDVTDLAILAANWGGAEGTWGDGDFTADGNVDDADLTRLAEAWGASYGALPDAFTP